jgi:predicted dehydrogenase
LSAVTRIAVVGLGQIAQAQHLPAIAGSRSFNLVAAASPAGSAPGVPVFTDIESMLESAIPIDAVALCLPPQLRFAAAETAIRAGKHVLLEKPPAASCLEVDALTRLAAAAGITLFAAWHSRFAPGVEPARRWLAGQRIQSIDIVWKEDVRQWHPGQQWIWQPGGFGVFDPGINALSILTRLLAEPLFVQGGTLQMPQNRDTPIAAALQLRSLAGIPVCAEFDWRQRGTQTWTITVPTSAGTLRLAAGGSHLSIEGQPAKVVGADEYPAIYERFAALLNDGASDVDVEPLRLVADAFTRCAHQRIEPFEE